MVVWSTLDIVVDVDDLVGRIDIVGMKLGKCEMSSQH